jgi:hypothetical protein
MTIHVPFPDDQMAALRRKAEGLGVEVEKYISDLVRRELQRPQSLNEVLADFREQVAASGISDEELDELFLASRKEIAV